MEEETWRNGREKYVGKCGEERSGRKNGKKEYGADSADGVDMTKLQKGRGEDATTKE